jgi:hypothetical protein
MGLLFFAAFTHEVITSVDIKIMLSKDMMSYSLVKTLKMETASCFENCTYCQVRIVTSLKVLLGNRRHT